MVNGVRLWKQGLRFREKLEMVIGNQVILDDRIALLLKLIDRKGSLLRAAKAVGMSYSRAWEAVARIERLLGVKIVESQRGGSRGGGSRLTEEGRKLVELFEKEYRRRFKRQLEDLEMEANVVEDLIYAGSHDILLERVFGLLSEKGVKVEVNWIGSMRGLAAVLLEEVDVAGIHIYDPFEDHYNLPILERMGASSGLAIVCGYKRLIGVASRAKMSLEEALEGLVEGRFTLANRLWGSGTRMLLETLLMQWARKRRVDLRELRNQIKGYVKEVETHLEAASLVASGKADLCITIEPVAKLYNLHFTPVKWEYFDFVIPKRKLEKKPVRLFIDVLKSNWFKELVEGAEGYEPKECLGSILNQI